MEKELNIVAILKDKPKGTKLWSPIFGEGELECVTENKINVSYITKGGCKAYWTFLRTGVVCSTSDKAEVLLFPSKAMRDWEKFAWKKGDILSNADSMFTFDKWGSEDYSTIIAKYSVIRGYGSAYREKILVNTLECSLCKDKEYYLKKIKNCTGGKLNLETLEIEKQPEFKDGDIVALEENCNYYGTISIFKKFEDGGINFLVYVSLINHKINKNRTLCCYDRKLRPTTVCQFTGLKDKNGVEIWEHDILKNYPMKSEVIFRNGSFIIIEDYSDEIKEVPLSEMIYEGICILGKTSSKFDRKEANKENEGELYPLQKEELPLTRGERRKLERKKKKL